MPSLEQARIEACLEFSGKAVANPCTGVQSNQINYNPLYYKCISENIREYVTLCHAQFPSCHDGTYPQTVQRVLLPVVHTAGP